MTSRPARPFCILIVAKAPISGRVKTRLCPPLTAQQAADVAAAAFLDTIAAATAAVNGDRRRIAVALDGELSRAARSHELAAALDGCPVIRQRGEAFGERLANAHLDAKDALPASPLLQIGMDTPHVTPSGLLRAANSLVHQHNDAVLGHAVDGGWWLLGLRDPAYAAVLRTVPMSTTSTGSLTRQALEAAGLIVSSGEAMQDIDVWADALEVRHSQGAARFNEALRLLPV